MSDPEGIKTVTLHGLYVMPDLAGTPLQGTVTFTPSPAVITFPVQNVVVAGTETATLDSSGAFSITLICTDTAGQNPDGWTYTVVERLIGTAPRTYQIFLPYTVTNPVELADISPTITAPTYLPVTGPQGPPGVITTLNGYSAATVNLTSTDVGAIPMTQKGATSGVATLDASSFLTAAQYNWSATTPVKVGTGAAGTSTQPARSDHTHEGVDLTTGQTVAGAKNFSTSVQTAKFAVGAAPGSQRAFIQSAVDEVVLLIQQTATTPANPVMLVQSSSATNGAFGASVAGDTQNRFNFTAGGSLTWGSGSAGTDVSINRSAAGELTVGGVLVVSTPTAAGHATRKDYVDGAGTFTGAKAFTNASSSANIVTTRATGDTVDRLDIQINGVISWGPGNAATDTNLYRGGVGVLMSDSQINTNNASMSVTRAASGSPGFKVLVTGDTTERLNIRADGQLGWGPGNAAADAFLSRLSSGALQLTSNTRLVVFMNSGATTATAHSIFLSGETVDRLQIRGDGRLTWSNGTTQDTALYRNSAGELKTDTALTVAGVLTPTPTSTSTGLTAVATGFTNSVYSSRTAAGITTAHLEFTFSGTTVTGSATGDISDIALCTLPSGTGNRPPFVIVGTYDKFGGSGDSFGSFSISSAGVVTLSTLHATASINTGSTVRIVATWVN